MPSPQSSTPQLFETASRPVRPASWMAAMRTEGMPQRPKPPTESDIPSRIPAMASWGVETTLSMAGLYPRGWPGVAWGRPTRSARRVVAEHVCRPAGIRARRRLQGAGVTRMNDSGVILGRREEQACNSLERLVMAVTGVHKWGGSKPFLTQNQPVPAHKRFTMALRRRPLWLAVALPVLTVPLCVSSAAAVQAPPTRPLPGGLDVYVPYQAQTICDPVPRPGVV